MLTKDTKLRFWCQKVLPLVYDDSLSYYELLNKVVLHLNQNTENINQLIDFYNTFAEDVEDIIRQMMEDGEFNEIVADTLGSIVAEEYDPTKSYIIFDYCIFDSKLYRANGSTTGVFDHEKWDEKTVGYDLTTIQNYIYSLNAGNVAYDPTASYDSGTVGNKIKNLNANDIAFDTSETYDDATAGKELKDLKSAINLKQDAIPNNIGLPAGNQTFASIKANTTSSGVTHTYLVESVYEGWVDVVAVVAGSSKTITITGGELIATFHTNDGSLWSDKIFSGGTVTALASKVDTLRGDIAPVETGTTASNPYEKDKKVIVNNQLYRVIQPIASGGTFIPNTNIKAMTADEFVMNDLGLPGGNITLDMIKNNLSRSGLRSVYLVDSTLGNAWVIILSIVFGENRTIYLFGSHIYFMHTDDGTSWDESLVI